MSGFVYPQPSSQSNEYNPLFYQVGDNSKLRYLTGVVDGVGTPNKALILDSAGSIDDIRLLGVSNNISTSFGTGAVNALTWGISINSQQGGINNSFHSNGLAFSRSNVVRSALLPQIDVSGNHQLAFPISNGTTLETNFRINRLFTETPELTISNQTVNIAGTDITGMLFHSHTTPFYGMRVLSTSQVSLLSLHTGGSYQNRLVYDNATTSLTLNGTGSNIICNDFLRAPRLQLNSTSSTDAQISLVADGLIQDGPTFDRVMRLNGRGTAPTADFKVLLSNVSPASVDGRPTWVGTSVSELRIGCNDQTRMTIMRSGLIGIGTNNPIASLDVNPSVAGSLTIATGGFAYGRANTGSYSSLTGPFTVNPCLFRVAGDSVITTLYISSDRRLKEDIEPLAATKRDMERFYSCLNPCTYKYKKQQASQRKLGVIAQDLAKGDVFEMLTFTEDNTMTIENEDDIEGFSLGVDYNALTVYNSATIKKIIQLLKQAGIWD